MTGDIVSPEVKRRILKEGYIKGEEHFRKPDDEVYKEELLGGTQSRVIKVLGGKRFSPTPRINIISMEYSEAEAIAVKYKGNYLQKQGVNIIPILRLQGLNAYKEKIPEDERYYHRVVVLEEPYAEGTPLTSSNNKEDLMAKWKMVANLRPEVIIKAFKDMRMITSIGFVLDTCPAENVIVAPDAIKFIDVHDKKTGSEYVITNYFSATPESAYRKIFAHMVGTGGFRPNDKDCQPLNKDRVHCTPEMLDAQHLAIEKVCTALECFDFKGDADAFDYYLEDNGIKTIQERKAARLEQEDEQISNYTYTSTSFQNPTNPPVQ